MLPGNGGGLGSRELCSALDMFLSAPFIREENRPFLLRRNEGYDFTFPSGDWFISPKNIASVLHDPPLQDLKCLFSLQEQYMPISGLNQSPNSPLFLNISRANALILASLARIPPLGLWHGADFSPSDLRLADAFTCKAAFFSQESWASFSCRSRWWFNKTSWTSSEV